MPITYDIALIGFGNVNRTLAQIIRDDTDRLTAELGFAMRVTAVTDLRHGTLVNQDGVDLDAVLAMRPDDTFAGLPGGARQVRNEDVIRHARADIVAEATFTNPDGGEPALSHVRWALEAGKSVVTTNKGPVAFAAEELKALAARHGVRFEYEGVVMSGTPVIRLANGPLKGAGMRSFAGILNGTSNFVLERMAAGLDQAAAIRQAQELGYAEADPGADIGGSDVRLKVMVLANEFFGVRLTAQEIPMQGITGIPAEAISQAAALGKRWKLIGRAVCNPDQTVSASVAPELLDASDPLAGVAGATNAVSFETDYLGTVTISGPGAGRMETAYALLSDIVAIHEHFQRNPAQRGPESSRHEAT